jgi:SIR2-like domain
MLADGDVVPFVGSGASRIGAVAEPKLPDGKGLATELVDRMSKAFPGKSTEDLAKVAQFFEHSFLDRDRLYKLLHRRFETEQKDNPPGEVARLLAAMPRSAETPLFIITTNYDSFIERAFHTAGRPICVITQNMRDPASGAASVNLILPDETTETVESTKFDWDDGRFEPGCAFLLKMHGSVHRPKLDGPDDVIITEDDYVEFMVNSGGSSSPYFPPTSLTRQYKKRRFLFLGYSLHDWNFRSFLRILAMRHALSGHEKLRHMAIQKRPDPLEVDLWEHRNVNVFDADLLDFCRELEGAWSTP